MEDLKFETALHKLEEIVEQLENGEQDLEASIRLFEEGIGLSGYCQEELRKAEGRVQQLLKTLDGGWETRDLE